MIKNMWVVLKDDRKAQQQTASIQGLLSLAEPQEANMISRTKRPTKKDESKHECRNSDDAKPQHQ